MLDRKTGLSPVVLVEPPLYDCRAPHLACAMLAARLQAEGYDVVLRDLNVEAILWLLQHERLQAAKARVDLRRQVLMRHHASGPLLSPEDRYALWRSVLALRYGEAFPQTVARALSTLRDSDRFYHPMAHRTARAVIDTALDVQAQACDPMLHISLCPQQYNGRHRATSLQDLRAAAQERQGNIFRPFFDQVAIPALLACKPRLVGVSISNVFQVIPGVTLARLLHDLHVFVVIGGPFFSKFGPQLAAMPDFFDLCDAVVIGEGEEALLGLTQALDGARDLANVPNLIFREGDRVIATRRETAPYVPDPIAADFRTLSLERYFCPEPVLPIYAGKGCGWSRCTFCEIPQVNKDLGRLRRTRHPTRVVEEMAIQGSRHGARHFVFTDESLEPWLLAGIADAIEETGLDVNYLGYARLSEAFDRRLCGRLARSGCRKLLFGLESGCQAVNDRCRKGVDLTKVPAIVEACQEAGIAVHIFSIVGLPGEGIEEVRENAVYLGQLARRLDLPVSTLDVSPFYLNWNSWLRRNASQAGIAYQAGQDFPLHTDTYTIKEGMDNQTAQATAGEVYRQVCWASSALGFEIGYRNPVWPGWEEYTLLYLSQRPTQRDRAISAWPTTERELLDKVVTVAQPLTRHTVPFPSYPDADAFGCRHTGSLVLAPAADWCEMSVPWFETISAQERHRVGDLVEALCAADGGDQDAGDVLAYIVHLIHAGILKW
jgi:hypothetical protein